MKDRQLCEIIQRRQIWSRINDLKTNCKELTEQHEVLEKRLNDLTDVVDQLIAERSSKKYNPDLKIDFPAFKAAASTSSTENHRADERNYSNSDRPVSNENMKTASDAFKCKLYYHLNEVGPKAVEILKLTASLESGTIGKSNAR